MQRFVYEGKRPRAVIVVEVKEVYMHCSKALRRSALWNPEKQLTKKRLSIAWPNCQRSIQITDPGQAD